MIWGNLSEGLCEPLSPRNKTSNLSASDETIKEIVVMMKRRDFIIY
jgi:hypothetical protein